MLSSLIYVCYWVCLALLLFLLLSCCLLELDCQSESSIVDLRCWYVSESATRHNVLTRRQAPISLQCILILQSIFVCVCWIHHLIVFTCWWWYQHSIDSIHSDRSITMVVCCVLPILRAVASNHPFIQSFSLSLSLFIIPMREGTTT